MPATTVLTPALLGAGTHYSSPLPWESGKNMVTARGLLADADIADAGNTLTLAIESSFDGGLSFDTGGKATWSGGGSPGPGGNPPAPATGTGYVASATKPSHVRVRLELPEPMSVGASLEFA